LSDELWLLVWPRFLALWMTCYACGLTARSSINYCSASLAWSVITEIICLIDNLAQFYSKPLILCHLYLEDGLKSWYLLDIHGLHIYFPWNEHVSQSVRCQLTIVLVSKSVDLFFVFCMTFLEIKAISQCLLNYRSIILGFTFIHVQEGRLENFCMCAFVCLRKILC
jgi:hypothetical protein